MIAWRSISTVRLDGESEHLGEIMKRKRTDRFFYKGTSYTPRPMSQSDRARLQPRNRSGRFIEYREKGQMVRDQAQRIGQVP